VNGRVAAMLASVLVTIGVGVGLYLAGSPGEARLHRQDDRREELLSSADFRIEEYHREHGQLPASLDATLPEWSRDTLRTRDPVTGIPFDYRATGDSAWELCATFARAGEGNLSTLRNHPAGRHCFSRRIAAPHGDDHDH
jgi:hypothetical protein